MVWSLRLLRSPLPPKMLTHIGVTGAGALGAVAGVAVAAAAGEGGGGYGGGWGGYSGDYGGYGYGGVAGAAVAGADMTAMAMAAMAVVAIAVAVEPAAAKALARRIWWRSRVRLRFEQSIHAICARWRLCLQRQRRPAATKLTLHVPAEAKVTLAGVATKQTGEVRLFSTSQLAAGQAWQNYTVHVELVRDGKTLTQDRQIALTGGTAQELSIDFGSSQLAGM